MTEHFGIALDNREVRATLETPSNSKGNVLWLLGRGAARLESLNDRQRQAELFERNMLTFDYSGMGETGGDFGQTLVGQHVGEAQAALDWMIRHCDGDNQTIMGASYGGYIAAVLATKNTVDSLVLRAPALFPAELLSTKWSELEAMMPDINKGYRQNIDLMKQNPTIQDLAKFAGRILIIQHGEDNTIPPSVLQAYQESLPNADYWLAPNAPDSVTAASETARDNYERYISDWLNT